MRAIIDFPLDFFICSTYYGKISNSVFNSDLVIVFIMKRLLYEKKKNEPLAPAPSPALNTLFLFFSISRL